MQAQPQPLGSDTYQDIEPNTVRGGPHDVVPVRYVTASSFNFWLAALCTILAGIVLFGVYKYKQLSDLIDARPPIAILDVNKVVMATLDGTPGLSAEAATRKTYETGAQLAKRGYVVLDRATIVAYPDDFEAKAGPHQ